MLARLSARGKSWEEFVELLAHFRVDEWEKEAKGNRALVPPRALREAEPTNDTPSDAVHPASARKRRR